MALRVVYVIEVDAEDEVGVGRLSALDRGGHDDLAGPGVDVAGGSWVRAPPAAGFDDDVGAALSPRRPSVFVLDDMDAPAGDDERPALGSHRMGEAPVDRVALEKVCEHVCGGDVVDRDDLEV